MKKQLLIILIILNVLLLVGLVFSISTFVLSQSSGAETNYGAIVKLEDPDNIECDAILALVDSLACTGYEYIRINDFYCYYNLSLCTLYEDSDSLTLVKNPGPHNLAMMPSPSEQYDLDKLRAWSKQHAGQNVQVAFGRRVKFNCMESISVILNQYSIHYYLAELLIGNQDKDIIIQRYQ